MGPFLGNWGRPLFVGLAVEARGEAREKSTEARGTVPLAKERVKWRELSGHDREVRR